MTDDTPVVEAEDGKEEEPQEPQITFSKDDMSKVRNEAAGWRVKLREAEQKLKDADDARLAEDKEWETLAGQRATEIEELTPYKERYNNMVESVAESNTRRIEAVPESMRSMVPDFDDPLKVASWLDANSQLLVKPSAPTVNGNAGGGTRPSDAETLSAAELEYARKTGVTAKEYQDAKR